MSDNIGSNYDDFLVEQGLLKEVSATAQKRVIAWQKADEMKAQSISKKALSEHMISSGATVDRTHVQNDDGSPAATKPLPGVN